MRAGAAFTAFKTPRHANCRREAPIKFYLLEVFAVIKGEGWLAK